jgi:hypothetical protein
VGNSSSASFIARRISNRYATPGTLDFV